MTVDIIRQLESRTEQQRSKPSARFRISARATLFVSTSRVTEGTRTRVQAYEGVCIAR